MGDNFFEKYFSVWENFPKDRTAPFEMAGDKLLGKLLEASEMEGDADVSLSGGRPNIIFPRATASVRSDPYFLRQGAPYRLMLHLRLDKVPQGVEVDVELWEPLKPILSLLSTEVMDKGIVVLYVLPIFRIKNIPIGFPIATLSFRQTKGEEEPVQVKTPKVTKEKIKGAPLKSEGV